MLALLAFFGFLPLACGGSLPEPRNDAERATLCANIERMQADVDAQFGDRFSNADSELSHAAFSMQLQEYRDHYRCQ